MKTFSSDASRRQRLFSIVAKSWTLIAFKHSHVSKQFVDSIWINNSSVTIHVQWQSHCSLFANKIYFIILLIVVYRQYVFFLFQMQAIKHWNMKFNLNHVDCWFFDTDSEFRLNSRYDLCCCMIEIAEINSCLVVSSTCYADLVCEQDMQYRRFVSILCWIRLWMTWSVK